MRSCAAATPTDVAKVQPAFDALKPEGEFGFVHAGEVGAGHFSKMVHNGMEYGIMQAYAEGWELLEKVDLVDNVTEVFRSWREGTVIRSWLLDLLVAALDDDDRPRPHRGVRRGLGRGAVDDRGGDRQRSPDARDHGCALLPLPVSPGRVARDESRRRDAQPVRWPRGPRGWGQACDPVGRCRARLTLSVHVSHLSLTDFRSYQRAEIDLQPGVSVFVGPNGQGKTNLVEAIDYVATQ